MSGLSYEQSNENYLKYKNDYEYDILIDSRNYYLLHDYQKNKKLTKKVFDHLYENQLINKEYYTNEIEKLQIQNGINYCNIFQIMIIIILIIIIINFKSLTIMDVKNK